jgi:PIN domain nuclease of toxin-antitoxin system
MSDYVADAHALYWHLTSNPRLSSTARQLFADADRGMHRIFVASIVLVERGRLDRGSAESIVDRVTDDAGSFAIAPLDLAVVDALRHLPRSAVPDMPDRIIIATAKHLGVPLITRDEVIRRAGIVPLVW